MGLRLVTPPAVEPVSLDDLKRHLRIEGDAEDVQIDTLLVVARATVEQLTGRSLLTQTWRWTLDRLPPDGRLTLPLRPVQTVSAVRIVDAAGGRTTLPGTQLVLDLASDPARLSITGTVPSPGVAMGGVEIDLVTGYGSSPDQVPPMLAQAVRLLTAHWYATRGDGDSVAIPADVAALVAGWRTLRLVA